MHQGGADNHDGEKHTGARRGSETRGELDTKIKQEAELKRRKTKTRPKFRWDMTQWGSKINSLTNRCFKCEVKILWMFTTDKFGNNFLSFCPSAEHPCHFYSFLPIFHSCQFQHFLLNPIRPWPLHPIQESLVSHWLEVSFFLHSCMYMEIEKSSCSCLYNFYPSLPSKLLAP